MSVLVSVRRLAGGITNPRNLATHTYVHNNPVKLTDPTGKSPIDSGDRTRGAGPSNPEITAMYPDYIPPDPRGMTTFMGQKVTQTEHDMLMDLSPLQREQVMEISAGAKRWAKILYGEDGYQDGEAGNAFQHAYLSARLAQEFGEDWSRRFTDAHEGSPNNGPMFQVIDRFNNAIGRSIGVALKDRPAHEIVTAIQNAVDRGMTIMLNGDRTGFEWTRPHR